MKAILKFVLSILVVCLTLEGVSRGIKFVMPLEVRQKFSNLKTPLKYTINGRGARGSWPRSEQIQIAIIGSSMVGMSGLRDEQTWTNLIEKHFDDRIHFDNYGIGFNKTNSTIKILQSISRRNIPYDIVILNISPDTHSISLKNALSMTYQARWDDQKYGPCAFCDQLQKFWKRRLSIEERFFPKIFKDLILTKQESALQEPTTPGTIHSHEIYRKVRSENRLKYEAPNLKEREVEFTKNEIAEMFMLAKKITPHVFWMPENIAYHKEMLPWYDRVYMRLTTIRPISQPAYYYDPKFYYEYFQLHNELAHALLAKYQVKEIDWIKNLQQLLPREEGLFFDEYHLSPSGSQRVAETLIPPLASYLKEEFKIQSK